MLKEDYQDEREKVTQLVEALEQRVASAPKGRLRISTERGMVRYYHRTAKEDRNGVYLDERNFDIARQLAQRDYDMQVLRVLKRQQAALDGLAAAYAQDDITALYGALRPERQALVEPIDIPNAVYAASWQAEPYKGKPFGPGDQAYVTERGENVRSKTEVIIANALFKANVPYKYEYPLDLRGMGVIYPDFTILNVRTRVVRYWEHFGMMDDEQYRNSAFRRMEAYELAGYYQGEGLISTFESRTHPINLEVVKRCIQHCCK